MSPQDLDRIQRWALLRARVSRVFFRGVEAWRRSVEQRAARKSFLDIKRAQRCKRVTLLVRGGGIDHA